MMSDLRDRIADVLAQHSWLPGTADCYCGGSIDWGRHPRHQADAVIAELGLSVTGGVIVGCLHDPPDYCNRCGIPHHSKCKRPADV
jgi:hypothetical protein